MAKPLSVLRNDRLIDHLTGDLIGRGTAGALDVDGLLVAEEIVESIFPTAENGEDFLDGAATVESETAGLQAGGFLGLGDCLDGGIVERCKPFQIAVWLRGDEDEVFIIESECPCRALLGLVVILRDPRDRVLALDF